MANNSYRSTSAFKIIFYENSETLVVQKFITNKIVVFRKPISVEIYNETFFEMEATFHRLLNSYLENYFLDVLRGKETVGISKTKLKKDANHLQRQKFSLL